MSTTLAAPSTRESEHELRHETYASHARDSQPAPGARWWFVFDRWLPVTDAADGQNDFVLA